MCYMFYNCDSLISLSGNNEIDLNASDLQININKMHHTFDGCRTLISLPDISKWNTSNVMDMVGMFRDCYSLISLPDISKWNTSNVKNMKYMFSGCLSLISLPDISKWNTSNANDIRGLFYECISLKSLPDLFSWNTSNVNNMRNMFYKCKSLSYLPDFCILNKGISYITFELTYQNKKNQKDKIRILGKNFIEINKNNGIIIYNNCEYELKEYFDDIDTNHKDLNEIKFLLCLDENIRDMSYIFFECNSLISVSRIYNLDFDKKNNSLYEINDDDNENSIYRSYEDSIQNLSQISSISNKNNYGTLSKTEKFINYFPLSFYKLKNMSSMFYECYSLISLPDLSEWDTSNVEDMKDMFFG